MAIDKTGKWWKGSSAADIDAYLVELNEGGYLPDRFVHSACACGAARFRVQADPEEGFAQRTCAECGRSQVMLDGEDVASAASSVRAPTGRWTTSPPTTSTSARDSLHAHGHHMRRYVPRWEYFCLGGSEPADVMRLEGGRRVILPPEHRK